MNDSLNEATLYKGGSLHCGPCVLCGLPMAGHWESEVQVFRCENGHEIRKGEMHYEYSTGVIKGEPPVVE